MAELEHQFTKVNGVTLHSVCAGPKDGPLMVFLHGFPEFWYGWQNQIAYFAEAGYRVVAPDQRGYNLSDRPRGIRAYQIDELARDMAELIAAEGRERAVVVGHDWGGAVAWWLAKQYPERVEKLVILNAPHWQALMDDLKRNPRQWFRSAYIGFFQIPRLPEWLLRPFRGLWAGLSLTATSRQGTFSLADLRQYQRAWSQPDAFTGMLNWYRAAVRFPPKYPENPFIAVPTLIIWGMQDRFLGAELARMSANYCINSRLVMFRNATHWVQHEEASQVNQIIQAFISPPVDLHSPGE